MQFALDTNTVSYYFRGEGNVARRLLQQSPANIFLTAVVVYELRTGVLRIVDRTRREKLEFFVGAVAVLPFGDSEATAAANIRIALQARGTPIGPYDVLIAATAMTNNLTLVSHNRREFERIAGLKLDDRY